MYSVTIPYSAWHQCGLYLEQNYYMHKRDYLYYHKGSTVVLDFFASDVYDMFVRRWTNCILHA